MKADMEMMKWQLLNRNTRGERKKGKEREKTHTNTPGAERANPERAREKKTEADGNELRPEEKGEDGSA